ncbi:anthrax toxin-like adenylyl cyclase domain-containing protein [Pseudomonas asplenii]|uniref:anthrax toxin-like adenylyl cyclase domain-containing protein n=1 Tax=Pseudomonas asplenii TaxID=53407 RepID=UPI0003643E33|nr:anthrax toxin-like adenylyl cyclase domain-containing protein [Pseudomonas fuscovaginae]
MTVTSRLFMETPPVRSVDDKTVLPSGLSGVLQSVGNVPCRDAAVPARELFPQVENSAGGLLYGEAFQAVADRYRVVLAVRSPNPLGEQLLKQGYASKSFHVKAKSSGTGPTAGFVAVNPAYSKVEAQQLDGQRRSIDDALSSGASSVDLRLSRARIATLLESAHMKRDGTAYRAEYPSGLSALFRIDEEGRVFDESGPVQVLTNPGDGRAITADYDLFAIYPRQAQSVNQRPLHVASRLVGHVCEGLRSRALPFTTERTAYEGAREHEDMGNIHGFGVTLVKALNQQIAAAGYTGGNLVWHGDETGNPSSSGFDPKDEPIFFFPADRQTGQAPEPRRVSSWAQLQALQGWLRDEGFHVEHSPRFGPGRNAGLASVADARPSG